MHICAFPPSSTTHLVPPLELAKIKSTPTDAQLASQIEETTAAVCLSLSNFLDLNPFRNKINKLKERLEPLRSGAPLVSPEDLAQLDKEWSKCRAEWVRRKKIFITYVSLLTTLLTLLPSVLAYFSKRLTRVSFWSLVTDALTPQESTTLAEELGIEFDTSEHTALERGPLCAPPSLRGSVLGKRRR